MRRVEPSGTAPARCRSRCPSPASLGFRDPVAGPVFLSTPSSSRPQSLSLTLRKPRRQPGPLAGRMTELQSALLLRRQLAGEQAGGGVPGRAAIADSGAHCLLPPFGRRPGGEGSRPARAGSTGSVPAGPSTSCLAFRGFWGRGRVPALALGRGLAPREWEGGRPSPTVRWGVAGEGLWIPGLTDPL